MSLYTGLKVGHHSPKDNAVAMLKKEIKGFLKLLTKVHERIKRAQEHEVRYYKEVREIIGTIQLLKGAEHLKGARHPNGDFSTLHIQHGLSVFTDEQYSLSLVLNTMSGRDAVVVDIAKDWVRCARAAKDLVNRYLLIREGFYTDKHLLSVKSAKRDKAKEDYEKEATPEHQKSLNDLEHEVTTQQTKLGVTEKIYERIQKSVWPEVSRLQFARYFPTLLEGIEIKKYPSH